MRDGLAVAAIVLTLVTLVADGLWLLIRSETHACMYFPKTHAFERLAHHRTAHEMKDINVTRLVQHYAESLAFVWEKLFSQTSREFGTGVLASYERVEAQLFSAAIAPDCALEASFFFRSEPCTFLRAVPRSGYWNLSRIVLADEPLRFEGDPRWVPAHNGDIVLFERVLNLMGYPGSHEVVELHVHHVEGADTSLASLKQYPIRDLDFFVPGSFAMDVDSSRFIDESALSSRRKKLA